MGNELDIPRGEEIVAFDWGLYAALIRKARKDLGYSTADSFAKSIYRRTRIKVSRDSLYKIEQAKQVPDAMQFMAINLALYHEPFPSPILDMCICDKWHEIIDSDGEIPHEWKNGNYLNVEIALAEAGKDITNLDEVGAAIAVGDKVDLFSKRWFPD